MTEESQSAHPPVSFRRAFGFAKAAFRANTGLFLSIVLTLFLLWAALEVIVYNGRDLGVVFNVGAHVIFLIAFAGILAGFLAICLNVCGGREGLYSDLFSRMAAGPAFLAAQLLYLVLILGGLVVLLAPGFYLASRCVFFGFHLAENGGGPVASLRRSIGLAKGRVARLFGYLLVLALLNLLGAALLGIGLLVTVPLSVLTLTSLYRQLSHD